MPRPEHEGAHAEPTAKRPFDVAAAGVGLVLFAPLMGTIAALICLDSAGPPLYRATRVGRYGRRFTMYKFRTMRAERLGQGARITHHDDNRITRVGRLLRRTRLDELPQLWNVLLGDMSLVGPRPEDPFYVDLYEPRQRRVLNVRPGMTSLTSLLYRDEQSVLVGPDWERIYVERVMAAKLDVDLVYVERQSVGLDVRILAATALVLLNLDGVAARLLPHLRSPSFSGGETRLPATTLRQVTNTAGILAP